MKREIGRHFERPPSSRIVGFGSCPEISPLPADGPFKKRQVAGPGLQHDGFSEKSCRPPALTRRFVPLLNGPLTARGLRNQTPVIFILHPARDGVADFFETGKVPEIWKVPALLRLDGLNRAIVSLEENASAVRLFSQGQTTAIRTQAHEALNELVLGKALVHGQTRQLGFGHPHLPGPTAASGATPAFVKDRHLGSVIRSTSGDKIRLPESPATLYQDMIMVRTAAWWVANTTFLPVRNGTRPPACHWAAGCSGNQLPPLDEDFSADEKKRDGDKRDHEHGHHE